MDGALANAMLLLPNVTLCCVDTQHPALAHRALRLSMAGIRFGQVLLFSDRETRIPGVKIIRISTLESRAALSQFMLKSLVRHLETDHVLVVQWDGHVIEPRAWTREFAGYDYIGAAWAKDGVLVGNGGFSLRSRKLLEALSDPRIVLEGNDEETICRHQRPLLEREFRISFAPPAVADRFSFDAEYPVGRPFGFRGLQNFWRVVPDGEMPAVLHQLAQSDLASVPLFHLGNNYLDSGQVKLAKAVFEKIVANDPSDADAVLALRTAREQASATGSVGARELCACGSGKRYRNCHGRRALKGDPRTTIGTAVATLADERVRIAQELHRRRDVLGAEAIYRSILAQSPDHQSAQHFLGVLLCEQEDIVRALPLLKASAERRPPNPDYLNNLAIALTTANRPNEAIEVMHRALSIAPGVAELHNTLGRAYQALNRIDEAVAAFRAAIAIQPNLVEAHWNLSLMLLLSGDYAGGWPEYEWRFKLGQMPSFPGAPWNGSIEPGLRLLVHTEQGFGDAIQFARYLPLLVDRGLEVFVQCPRVLHRLFRSIHAKLTIVESGQQRPDVDAHFPLVSLARLYSPSIAAIPARVPYLAAPPEASSMWRQRLATHPAQRKIGLAWAGRTRTLHEKRRPIPLTALARLAALPDTVFVSLQKEDERNDHDRWPGVRPMFDWTGELTDFAETAALIEALDVVVSIDTGVAHLAGALGKPVYVLLPFPADWRWLLDRTDSPWYPTARLLRQQEPENWGPVVRTLIEALS